MQQSIRPIYWWTSFAIHVLIVGIFFLRDLYPFSLFKSQNPFVISPSSQSIRVDIVEMPKHTLLELQNTSAASPAIQNEVVNTTKPSESEDPPPEPSEAEYSDSFLSAVKKIKKMKNKPPAAAVKKKLPTEADTQLESLIRSGNQLSQGLGVTGKSQGRVATPLEIYGADLAEQVRTQWKLPPTLFDLKLSTVINIRLNNDGNIIHLMVFKSSLNQQFDELALKAIKEAAPFASPTDEIRSELRENGIYLSFPLITGE